MKASRQVLQAVRADWSAFVMAVSLDSSPAVHRIASPDPPRPGFELEVVALSPLPPQAIQFILSLSMP